MLRRTCHRQRLQLIVRHEQDIAMAQQLKGLDVYVGIRPQLSPSYRSIISRPPQEGKLKVKRGTGPKGIRTGVRARIFALNWLWLTKVGGKYNSGCP